MKLLVFLLLSFTVNALAEEKIIFNRHICNDLSKWCQYRQLYSEAQSKITQWLSHTSCILNELSEAFEMSSNSVETYPNLILSEVAAIVLDSSSSETKSNSTSGYRRRSYLRRLTDCVDLDLTSIMSFRGEEYAVGRSSGYGHGGGGYENNSLNAFLLLGLKIVSGMVGFLGYKLFS